MAYGEYKNAGRCTGKCLYQLRRLGIPLHVVETVIFESSGLITSSGHKFASYVWLEGDLPYFNFYPLFDTYNELQMRWHARYCPVQEFVIINHQGPIDACAQFKYKGYQVSMTTIGISQGACRSPVEIFSDADADGYYTGHVGSFNTVEEAIKYIDGDSTVEPIRLTAPIIHEIEFVTGD